MLLTGRVLGEFSLAFGNAREEGVRCNSAASVLQYGLYLGSGMWGVNTRWDANNREVLIVTQWLPILPEYSPGNLS